MDISRAVQSAFERYQAGSLREAANICIEILAIQPNKIDVLLLLGEICTQLGNYDAAIECFKEAVKGDPASGEAYFSLGNIFLNRGRVDESISCYERALQLKPDFAEAYNNLGNALEQKGLLDEAILCYEKALQLYPDLIDAYNNLGVVFQKKGEPDKAIDCYQKMIERNPGYAEAYSNMGTAFQEKGMLDRAIDCYYKATQLNPAHANAYYNLGNALKVQGKLDAALESYRHSLRINPVSVKAFNNLGNLHKDLGHLNEAEDCYRRALQIDPWCSSCHSNLLFLLNYNFRYDAKTVFSEHLKFAKQFEESLLPAVSSYINDRTVRRRLRLGYVSPDFKGHSVAYFVEPVLIEHDREQFEVFCYSDVPVPDMVTGRIRGHADQWRSIAGMQDEQVAELIRSDSIDILVDLAGHASNIRLLLFARKPAPVQASWIGYPATTGLSCMGYKIVDHYTDPPGMTEQFYTEELLRMPENFLCYLPDRDNPGVGKLPALTSGHVTFGSFNNFAKVSPEAVSLWSEILKTVTDSRLIIKAKSLSDKSVRGNMLEKFAQNGVAARRIDLLSWEPTTIGHLNTYNRIDIGLDTFPYNGTTTTCEALWMGVPVITMAGDSHASRVGASLLSNIGLQDLIADTRDRYVDIAVGLAAALQRLQSLREGLRAAMQQSPLCDAKRFTANLEGHFRGIWKRWCEYS